MHNGLITFGDEKMSKSLGNFVTVDAVLEEYHHAFVRYAVLQHHYRSPMEFSKAQLETMKRGWERLNKAYQQMRVESAAISPGGAREKEALDPLVQSAQKTEEKFFQAMADDFNTPAALASLFELIRDARPYFAGGETLSEAERAGLSAAVSVLERIGGGIFGVLTEDDLGQGAAVGSGDEGLVQGLVELIIELRTEARQAREFDKADRLRDRLQELGIVLEDRSEGTRWSFKE